MVGRSPSEGAPPAEQRLRRRPPGFPWGPLAALTVGALAAGALFAFAASLGPGLSLVLAMIPLLSLAAALFLTIPELPGDRPGLRRVAAVILAAGGAGVLLMTPFGAMALVALASP